MRTTRVVNAVHDTHDSRRITFALSASEVRSRGGTQNPDPHKISRSTNQFPGDIAIMYLSKPFVFNYDVWPVCIDFDLDSDRIQLTAGNLGKVAGWGLIDEDGKMSPELQVAELPYVEIDRCIDDATLDFRCSITSDKICAGYTNVQRCAEETEAETSCSQKKRKDCSDITQEALLRPHPRTTRSATPT
ncbi:Coagulation factor IX [Eumeta japonica]|uniref:Coagulation factor IX n=1 Tax=Eumeta variegata TaxID=151549 RepID=A0A4C1V371_EUMVA|nr:Coagulation factor IX [Eumeta japonica]